MNFWKYDVLAKRLRKGQVSEKEKAIYFFIFYFIFFLYVALPSIIGYDCNLSLLERELIQKADILDSIISISTALIGLYVCCHTNRKGDNKSFIERIVCLSFPIGIRMIVYLALFSVFLFIGTMICAFYKPDIDIVVQNIIDESNYITAVVSSLLYNFIYFYILNKGIKIAASKRENNSKIKRI